MLGHKREWSKLSKIMLRFLRMVSLVFYVFSRQLLCQNFPCMVSSVMEGLCSPLKLIHGAVKSKNRGEVHEAFGREDGLEGDEEGTPPRQDQDLFVGSDTSHGLLGDELWFQDWDDLGLDSGEHAGVDVVGADDGGLDVTRVTTYL